MASSDSHLEKALAECNATVDRLEQQAPSAELVDAYVKRGRILDLMGYGVSSTEDLETAAEMLQSLLDSGVPVDPDICFRTFAILGATYKDDDEAAMRDCYDRASSYIAYLAHPLAAARTCLEVASDLMEAGDAGSARVFVKAALCTRESDDPVNQNLLLEALFLMAETYFDDGKYSYALDFLAEGSGVGSDLMGSGRLDDPLLLALTYVYLAECLIDAGDKKAASANLAAVSAMLEDRKYTDSISDDVLSELHGQIGKDYMEIGEIDTAEKHLMRQAAFSLSGDDVLLRDALQERLERRK